MAELSEMGRVDAVGSSTSEEAMGWIKREL